MLQLYPLKRRSVALCGVLYLGVHVKTHSDFRDTLKTATLIALTDL